MSSSVARAGNGGSGGPRSAAPILLAAGLLAVIAGIAWIGLAPSAEERKRRNESVANRALGDIAVAQMTFREQDKDGNGKPDFAKDLEALARAGLIGPGLASGTDKGYVFKVLPGKDPLKEWFATAEPLEPGTTGDEYFYIDQTLELHHEKRRPANASSPTAPMVTREK